MQKFAKIKLDHDKWLNFEIVFPTKSKIDYISYYFLKIVFGVLCFWLWVNIYTLPYTVCLFRFVTGHWLKLLTCEDYRYCTSFSFHFFPFSGNDSFPGIASFFWKLGAILALGSVVSHSKFRSKQVHGAKSSYDMIYFINALLSGTLKSWNA